MDRKFGFLIDLLVLIGALVAVILIGRGGGSDDSSSGDVKNLDTKPKIEASSDAPPTELETEDIVVGDGAEAKEGDTVSVQYVGAIFDTGKEFDASWTGSKPGQPFEFTLGAGQVIPGWDQGVAGMKVGGRRKLVIPPDLGYGEQGSPPSIPGNATLVFYVDLEKVTTN
ncbi:MAG: FKBP-type peptidyl-prolyl cis-trans isomerase [Solirubrobacterales bacterium]|nr:FKBP-type peptidyl-prolyl cis-trans isomerase [Solirubrobacterales bacterium]